MDHSEGPIYEHDCEHCRYIGTSAPTKKYPTRNAVDCYFHKTPSGGTVIQRGSSRPDDYLSWPYESQEGEPSLYTLMKSMPEFSLAH